MEGSERITTVEIYGQTYHVRGMTSPEYIAQLATYVDEKMHEVSEQTPTVDTLKVAILAALNISDQFFATRQKLETLEQTVIEKSDQMANQLNALLGPKSP